MIQAGDGSGLGRAIDVEVVRSGVILDPCRRFMEEQLASVCFALVDGQKGGACFQAC